MTALQIINPFERLLGKHAVRLLSQVALGSSSMKEGKEKASKRFREHIFIPLISFIDSLSLV